MTEGSGARDAPHPFTDEARALGIDVDNPHALAWMEAHLPEYRQQASGQRPLYWILGIGFVVGLAAHVGGYLLRSSVTTEPLLLVADLLYALGWALWTSVIVVFVQIWPEAKRRQLKRRSMPTRQRCASRPEPEAARRRGTTERRGQGRGQAEPPAGWCDTSWSMTPHGFSPPLENRVGGHIRATNSRIAAYNSGHYRSRFLPAHQPHSARQRRSPRASRDL